MKQPSTDKETERAPLHPIWCASRWLDERGLDQECNCRQRTFLNRILWKIDWLFSRPSDEDVN